MIGRGTSEGQGAFTWSVSGGLQLSVTPTNVAVKAHTNAVTESMVSTGRSWSDADGLLAGLRDDEGRASAQRYLDRVRTRRA